MSTRQALKEIKASDPYLNLLAQNNIKKSLRRILIKEAPAAVLSVLSQVCRHILNGTFCFKNKSFCNQFENSLYIFVTLD